MILAFDPGGRNTGIVLRSTPDRLAGWTLAVRAGSARMPDGVYVRQVLSAALTILRDAGIDPTDRDTYVVGVEGIAYWPERDPKVRRDQRGLYGTAVVLGAILARWPDAYVVDSGRGVANYHPQAYPEAIRPPANGAGKDRLNHVRAAWDHSHATETVAKTERRATR
jgi:hypothetical protein